MLVGVQDVHRIHRFYLVLEYKLTLLNFRIRMLLLMLLVRQILHLMMTCHLNWLHQRCPFCDSLLAIMVVGVMGIDVLLHAVAVVGFIITGTGWICMMEEHSLLVSVMVMVF